MTWRTCRVALVLVGSALLLPPASLAQEKPPENAWVSQCISAARGSAANCSMEQRLSVQETGQLFATVVVQVPASSRTPEFVLTTPLGLFLPAGVKLAVDGSPFLTLPVRNCDGNGCYALAALSDANISMLKQGGSMNVALQNLANQAVKFDVSLIGFSAAFDGIK